MEDRVLIQFQNKEQAQHFFNWFKKEGFNQMIDTEDVSFEGCISADELPGEGCSDPDAYYLEIE
jgi:hypothetical protein